MKDDKIHLLKPGDEEAATLDEDIEGTQCGRTKPYESSVRLQRTMGPFSATMLMIGASIGSGIFSTPSGVYRSVGSVGMALIIWVIGAVHSLLGAMAYIELGAMLPRSGGEKEYLDYIYRKPKALMPFIFSIVYVFLVNPISCAADATVTGTLIVYAAGAAGNAWLERGIGVAVHTACCILHSITVTWGVRINDAITFVKILILATIAVTGLIVACGGLTSTVTPTHALSSGDVFAGTATSPSDYAAALFKVIFTYGGWNNINYVVDELKDPIRTLKVASISGMTLLAFLCVLANIAYFAVVPADVVYSSTTTVAAEFLVRVFGSDAATAMPLLIAISTFGCTSSMTFVGARITLEAAKEGYIPFGHYFGTVNRWLGTPVAALALHWAVTLPYMLAPPAGDLFNFIVDLGGYTVAWFYGLVVIGLFWLRYREPEVPRPFRSFLILDALFIMVIFFVVTASFIRPERTDMVSIAYWVYPTTGVAFILCCVPLWYIRIKVQRALIRSLNAMNYIAQHHLDPSKLSDVEIERMLAKESLDQMERNRLASRTMMEEKGNA
ncbi:high affinity methionine permease [Dichotomocladium elegans]|nr:high affinity methionine permease [Dichotomocladium elegans]